MEIMHMKFAVSVAFITSSVVAFSIAEAAIAQSAGPIYESTIHQSAGDRDSRGTPKYYQRYGAAEHHSYRHGAVKQRSSTVGAGRAVPVSGPFYSNSIHQSAGDRDSRGTPKYCPGGRC